MKFISNCSFSACMFVLFAVFHAFWLPTSSALANEHSNTLYIVTENYPPYEMNPSINGRKGFDFEVANAVFKKMGYAPNIVFLPWKRALKEAEEGATIGILTCAYQMERESFIIFSEPLSGYTHGFYVRADFNGPVPKSINDIVGQRVASIRAYTSLQELKDIGSKPLAAPNVKSAVLMLRDNRFDYLYVSKEATDFEIKNLGMTSLFKFYPTSEHDFHFCFSKKYPGVEGVVSKFNSALTDLKKSGLYDKIHASYK
ncbi:MAG: transporter substrate-binding domain-containing protein [Sneathiella sp.]|nr:transporter substrate-binding domain-containing protein [Sneathiella sp.]